VVERDLSACLSAGHTSKRPAETAEPIEMPFGGRLESTEEPYNRPVFASVGRNHITQQGRPHAVSMRPVATNSVAVFLVII